MKSRVSMLNILFCICLSIAINADDKDFQSSPNGNPPFRNPEVQEPLQTEFNKVTAVNGKLEIT